MRSRGAEIVARTRAVLNRDLFRTDLPAAWGAQDRLALGAFAALAVGVQLLRMWSSRPLDTLWAEDGSVWLSGALDRSPLDALTTPYNGYVQLLSRAVGEPVAALPLEAWAPVMALLGAAIVAGCACFVWRASAGYIDRRGLRWALASLVILLPVVGFDSLANVTNTIWFLLYACVWALLWRPESRAGLVAAAGLIAIAALSNLAVIFLLPLWGLRLLAARDRRDWAIVGAFAAALVVQLALSAGEIGLRGEEGDPLRSFDTPGCEPVSTNPCWDWDLVPAYAQRIVGGAVAGQPVNGELWKLLGPALVVALGVGLVALVVVAVRRSRTRLLVPLLIGTSIALFLAAGYVRWGAGGNAFLWAGDTYNEGNHYFVVPTLLLLTAIVLVLDRVRPAIAMAAMGLVLMFAALGFAVGNSGARGEVSWSEAVERAAATCRGSAEQTVAIPTGTVFDFPVEVPCDRLM